MTKKDTAGKAPNLTTVEWKKFADTPANGEAFYNARLDQTAIRYRHCTRLYFNRISGIDNWAINFKDCFLYNAVTSTALRVE